MKRRVATAILTLLALVGSATPAGAENKTYAIAPGGMYEVSKTPFYDAACVKTGAPTGGLGTSVFSGVKKGYWRLEASLINSTTQAPVDMVACGKLNPILRRQTGGIGASCEESKGYDGKGAIDDTAKGYRVHLSNLAWKVHGPGNQIVITGHVTWTGKAADKGTGKIAAAITLMGGDRCRAKSVQPGTHKKQTKAQAGATSFRVMGAVGIAQGAAADNVPKPNDRPGSPKGSQDNPATCKNADPAQCPTYGPKKDP